MSVRELTYGEAVKEAIAEEMRRDPRVVLIGVGVMFGAFITLTMDQMVNQAAKAHYMSGGKIKVPIVFRTTLGATRRSAAQHSQSLHAWVSHVPGLKVAL